MASPKGLAGTGSAIAEALGGFFSRDPIDSMQEYNFGGRDYLPGFGGYPAARPLDVIDPYTEIERSAILPRKPEDVTDYRYGRHGKIREDITDYGQGPFAVLERELLAPDKPPYQGFMTNALITNYGDSGRKNIQTSAPMVKFLPDGTMKLSGGVNQVIPGSTTQSFADEIEAERTGINFSGDVQDRLRSGFFQGPEGDTRRLKTRFPGAAEDLLRHYAFTNTYKDMASKLAGDKVGGFLTKGATLAKEALDMYGTSKYGDEGGLSLDDILANEAALKGISAQDAFDAGVFTHTEGVDFTGLGQGTREGVYEKALALGLENSFPFKKHSGRVSQPIIDYPTNIHPAIAPQIEQPFIPQFDLEPDLNLNRISPPEGSVAPYQGPVDWDYTPSREDWFPERINYSVGNERPFGSDPSILDKVMPQADIRLSQLNENFDRVMPDASIPFDPADESELFGTFDSTTPGQIGDYLRAQEQEWILPSGPEEMTEVFTEEDKIAEDERIRLDKIMTKAREDRIAQEKIAADARRAKEADETRARELREEAARAEDRQDKARLSREAEERDRQAQERAQEERNAAEAARLNSLAEAADKMAIDQERKQQEEQARKQAEFNKQHEAFVKQMDRDWRARQQASMPKSWAFF